jgi:predicted nucleic acid-binding protein
MTKTFRHIPSGVPVMLDANIVIYAFFPQVSQHEPCQTLLERGAQGDIQLHLTVNTAADVIHRTMVLELMAQGRFRQSSEAVMHLKKQPEVVQSLARYKTILRDLRQARINILPLTYLSLEPSNKLT